ncbi:uncharacterized protein LOC135848393 [Planococcus citri]|uniref:uncharacterized protein LOC135848393 n=1 Tax=Planococcus citri TaxID=170843 RepID=UPI0031F72F20
MSITSTDEALSSLEEPVSTIRLRIIENLFKLPALEREVLYDDLSRIINLKKISPQEARSQAASSCEDSNGIRIAELEERIRQLSKSERDLNEELVAKSEQILDLEQIITSQAVENEELRENNFLLEARVLQLSDTVTDLNNELTIKNLQLQEMEDKFSNAIATAVQDSEELSASVRIAEFETAEKFLLEAEVVDLRNDIEMKNLILEQIEENCATTNSINDDLRKRNKQHLRVNLQLEKELQDTRTAGWLDVKENVAEANSFDKESSRSRASQDPKEKVQAWLDNID